MKTYYLDKRLLVSGKSSKINLDNYLSLTKVVNEVLSSSNSGSGYTAGSGLSDDVSGSKIDLGGQMTKDAIIDSNNQSFTLENSITFIGSGSAYDLSDFGIGSVDSSGLYYKNGSKIAFASVLDAGGEPQVALFQEKTGSTKTLILGDIELQGSVTNGSTIGSFRAEKDLAKIEASGNGSTIGKVEVNNQNNDIQLSLIGSGGQSVILKVVEDGGDGKFGITIDGLQTYADDAAAGTAGLTTNTLYKTATGELRIKV